MMRKKIRENACKSVSKDFPIELVQEIEDDFYVKECWNSRNAELRFLYMVPTMIYNLFSYLVNVNGIEWIEFILNDAKMDYIEVSDGWKRTIIKRNEMEGLEKFREAFEAFTHIPQIPQSLFLRKSPEFS